MIIETDLFNSTSYQPSKRQPSKPTSSLIEDRNAVRLGLSISAGALSRANRER
jgi:hypothetical protein